MPKRKIKDLDVEEEYFNKRKRTDKLNELRNYLENLKKRKQELEENKEILQKRFQNIQQKVGIEDIKDEVNNNNLLAIEFPEHKITIPPFDMRKLNTSVEGQRVGIFGMTGSGKSKLAIDIMRYNKSIPLWTIYSSSESCNNQYGCHMENDLFVFDHLDIKMLKVLKERQIRKIKEWKIGTDDNVTFKHDPSAAVIIDDAVEEEKDMKDPIFSYYHCVSRHHYILFIELFQYYTMLIPKFRRQLSYVFIMRPNSEKDIKAMHNEFFGMYTYKVFKEIVQKATVNHGALVIDVLSQDENRVFFYKATYPTPQFIIGTKYSRMLMKHYYDPNWEENKEKLKEIESNTQKEAQELEEQIKFEEEKLKKQENYMKTLERKLTKAEQEKVFTIQIGNENIPNSFDEFAKKKSTKAEKRKLESKSLQKEKKRKIS